MTTMTKHNLYRAMLAVLAATALALSLLAPARPADAAFPGKNGKIVFTSNRTEGPNVFNAQGDYEIFSMNPDGTGLRQLTHNSAHDTDPVVSPSGIEIAFTSYRDGNGEIYTMDIYGNNQTRRTDSTGDDKEPAFSPLLANGGIKIAFTSARDGDYEIYKMNRNGSNEVPLTNNAGYDEQPAWSPDGSKIVFTSDRDGDREIYTMDASGMNPTNLTNTNQFSRDFQPTFSPNGSKIAFTSDRDANNREVYVMDSDGTGQARFTNNPSIDEQPAFSPDGRKIAFMSARSGDYEIYTMGALGVSPTNISSYDAGGNAAAATDFLPDWGRRPVLQQL